MTTRRLTLILACASLATAAAQPAPPAPSSIPTSTIDIDGATLRVRSSFSKPAATRGPVVVFESGASIPLETWDAVLDKVAAFAPVVAYDRPGTGQSSWDNQPLTPERQNRRLKTLLDTLGVSSPIVLVGHSWGGALSRYFVGEYPQAVKAVLYIDPTDVTMTEALFQQMFASFGATAKDVDAFFAVMEASTRTLSPAIRDETSVMMRLLRTHTLDERRLKPAPAIPSSVLMASRIGALPKGMVPFDGEAYAKAFQAARVTGLRAWVQGSGQFLVVEGSGHFVYRDAPDVVIKEIQRLVATPAAP